MVSWSLSEKKTETKVIINNTDDIYVVSMQNL